MLTLDRTDNEKPRLEGITSIIDKLQPLDIENFKNIVSYVDSVKIPQSCFLLYSPTELERRIKFYHEHNISVAIDSKITDYALTNNTLNEYLREILSFGFNIIEVEVNMNNNFDDNQKITEISNSFGIELQWKFNKKNSGNNIYHNNIFEKIRELLKISKTKMILGIDQKVDLNILNRGTDWRFISSLISTYSQSNFIFETDIESLQINLISKFGERVNLGLIDPFQVGLIEWSRRKDYSKLEKSFDKQSTFNMRNISGGPSVKFIYFILKSLHPIDQTELMRISELPRRTVQASISELKRQGVIFEILDPKDARKKIYELSSLAV
ncbi:MAG TPA: phosphosulfolactate synthase [Nitrososphaeraceae archaeon]